MLCCVVLVYSIRLYIHIHTYIFHILIHITTGDQQSEINIAEGRRQAVVMQAKAESEAIELRAQANSRAITMVSEAIQVKGGTDAVSFRIAQDYVAAFAKLAKEGNTLLLPADAGNPANMVAQAMSVFDTVKSSRMKSQAANSGGDSLSGGEPEGDMMSIRDVPEVEDQGDKSRKSY
jgi:hypothetical protein